MALRMNVSIGWRIHWGLVTGGATGSVIGRSDQCCRAFWTSIFPTRSFPFERLSPSGWGAPRLIHSFSSSTFSSANLPSGGIRNASSLYSIAETIKLSSGSPAINAGPETPPASIPANVSSRRSDCASSSPWQSTHFSISSGRILFSKNSRSASDGGSAARTDRSRPSLETSDAATNDNKIASRLTVDRSA